MRCNLWGCETAPHRGQVLIAHNSTVNIKTKMHTKDLCSPCMSRLNDESMTILSVLLTWILRQLFDSEFFNNTVSMTSVIQKRSAVHDLQVAIMCYYASSIPMSIHHDSAFRSIQLHTYQPSQSRVAWPSVSHLRRIIAGLFSQLASARLSSIQTIQHALHQLNLAFFYSLVY